MRDDIPEERSDRYKLLRIMRWMGLSAEEQTDLCAPMKGKTDAEKESIATELLKTLSAPEPQTPVNNVFFHESPGGCFKASKVFDDPYENVFGFQLHFDMGRIGDGVFGKMRREDAKLLWPFIFDWDDGSLEESEAGYKAKLAAVLARAAEGGITRIWYSDQGYDLCGLCWLMAELTALPKHGPIRLVKLPHLELHNDIYTENDDWGQLDPKDWEKCLPLEEEADDEFCRILADRWEELREENARLRVVIGGKICSVPEDFWDWYILKELGKMPQEFEQAIAIGIMLQRAPFTIDLNWLDYRIEEMVRRGLLEVLRPPEPGGAEFRRRLRKTERFPRP